ncbi:C-C motif chemokine 20-like [Dendropsophus ebraccatus]|uniref:C-C motif chemokine 20-like n=1 Tax=Dendropsophus ebraccatus TaxID=150705 RepID=UPI0038322491
MISRRSLSMPLALTLIILAAVSPVFGHFDCCTRYTNQRFKVSQVAMFEDYYFQDSSDVCDIDAFVFTVNATPCGKPKRITLCADPEKKWVEDMITAMKKLAKKSKKHQQKKKQKLCRRKKTRNYV